MSCTQCAAQRTPNPARPTEAQRRAREEFDIDKAMAALPATSTACRPQGAAGVRLRRHHVAVIPEGLLREFARDTLGAKRMSKQYLDALRVVLGNKADASCRRYVLELNIRVPFAAERVMRTIIDQMKRAGLTYGQGVALGNGRTQVVQCFGPRRQECADEDAP